MRHLNGEVMKRISLDWWTVIAALVAVALIKTGLVPGIGW